MSMNHLAVAVNLSAERGWLGFYRETLNAAGERVVEPYNRFPIGGRLLLSAVMLPFADDPGAQLQAARRLTLACFVGAIVFAYLALRRLSGSASVALAATLFGFSSFYPMKYFDLIATEAAIDLFAVMLAFHGLALFALERRFGQLLAKACAALALGWHVYGLLLPFVALSLLAEWRRGGCPQARIGRLARSRGARLGAVALAFGLALLSFNFAREYAAVRAGETIAPASSALSELPSFRSMSRRLGWDAEFIEASAGEYGWGPSTEATLFRIGRAFLPWCAERLGRGWRDRFRAAGAPVAEGERRSDTGEDVEPELESAPEEGAQAMTLARKLAIAFGAGAIVATGLGIAFFARHRAAMAALATFGLCWGLLLPGSVSFHHFEGMFVIGVPMAAICLALTWARRFSESWARGGAVAAFLIFAGSVAQLPRIGPGDDARELPSILADYEAISRIAPKGAVIRSDSRRRRYASFFLPDRVYVGNGFDRRHAVADFALSPERGHPGLLTPNNRATFLYSSVALPARSGAAPRRRRRMKRSSRGGKRLRRGVQAFWREWRAHRRPCRLLRRWRPPRSSSRAAQGCRQTRPARPKAVPASTLHPRKRLFARTAAMFSRARAKVASASANQTRRRRCSKAVRAHRNGAGLRASRRERAGRRLYRFGLGCRAGESRWEAERRRDSMRVRKQGGRAAVDRPHERTAAAAAAHLHGPLSPSALPQHRGGKGVA